MIEKLHLTFHNSEGVNNMWAHNTIYDEVAEIANRNNLYPNHIDNLKCKYTNFCWSSSKG